VPFLVVCAARTGIPRAANRSVSIRGKAVSIGETEPPKPLESRHLATREVGLVGLVPPNRSVPAQNDFFSMRGADGREPDWLPRRRDPPRSAEEHHLH
jgi:hypothetical protein